MQYFDWFEMRFEKVHALRHVKDDSLHRTTHGICKKLRLKLAIEEHEDAMGALSLRKFAASYGVSRTTMQARIKWTNDRLNTRLSGHIIE